MADELYVSWESSGRNWIFLVKYSPRIPTLVHITPSSPVLGLPLRSSHHLLFFSFFFFNHPPRAVVFTRSNSTTDLADPFSPDTELKLFKFVSNLREIHLSLECNDVNSLNSRGVQFSVLLPIREDFATRNWNWKLGVTLFQDVNICVSSIEKIV